MKETRYILMILVLVGSTSGATCLPRGLLQNNHPPSPVVFEEFPSLDRVLEVVNANQRVKQLDAQGARLKASGSPSSQRWAGGFEIFACAGCSPP